MRAASANLVAACALAAMLGEAGANDLPVQGRPSDARLLRDAVVSAATLMAVRPDLDRDLRTGPAIIKIMFVTQIFDSLGAPHDLELLASLASYRLGAAGGEVFHCVVLGKGSKIRAALTKLRDSKRNECVEVTMNSQGALPSSLCLSDEAYRARLTELIALVRESCERPR